MNRSKRRKTFLQIGSRLCFESGLAPREVLEDAALAEKLTAFCSAKKKSARK